METPVYKRQEMLSVSSICKLIPGKNGGPCSRQHIYNLIESGGLAPAFKFGGKYNIHVPRSAVEEYLRQCRIDPGE